MTQSPRMDHWRQQLATTGPWILLTLALTGIAWTTTPFAYSTLDALAFACAYAALAAAVCAWPPLEMRFDRDGRLTRGLIVGLLLAWHWREQTRPPGVGATLWTIDGLLPFIGSAIVGGVSFFLVERSFAPPPRHRSAGWTVAATVAFLALWVALFHLSETTRWHLLNHNRLLGTPAYHAFATPTPEIEEALWKANSGAVDTSRETRALAISATAGETPSNIVVVLIDTLRADGLADWGGDRGLMPFLNRYASGAYTFTDVLSNSSWTRPSIASLFTGLLPEEHGAVGWEYVLDPERLTLAEILQERGYETAGFVANRQAIRADAGFGQGFDTYDVLSQPREPYSRADAVNAAVADWLAARAEAADGADASSPAFLYVHYLDPHTPYLVGGTQYIGAPPTDHAAARRLYDRELSYLDPYLEELTTMVVEELGDNTAILFTSDHGEEFGEHGQRGHGQSLYEELVRVPVILRLADGRSGRVTARLESRDLFELILRLQDPGALNVERWAGDSDRPVRYASVSNSKDPGRSQWVHELLRPYRNNILLRLIDRGNEQLIWSAYGDTHELYDMAADPGQQINLARQRPQSIERLRADLEQAVRWWAPRIPRDVSLDALEDLRALGYLR